jgi:hypothetical protein
MLRVKILASVLPLAAAALLARGGFLTGQRHRVKAALP